MKQCSPTMESFLFSTCYSAPFRSLQLPRLLSAFGMKFLLATLFLVATLATSATAQMKERHAELPGSGEPSAAKVEDATRQISNQLRLNEAQYIKLRSLNKIKFARLDEIQWQYQDDAAMRDAKLLELESQFETECSRILTPTQLSIFQGERKREETPQTPVNNEGGIG
jgi:hypothetical protein